VKEKIKALADFINASRHNIRIIDRDTSTFSHYDEEYQVLDEAEADATLYDAVMFALPSMPFAQAKDFLKAGVTEEGFKALQALGGEGIMPLSYMLKDLDAFVQGMADLNGRGYYLAGDGEENSENEFYIYRLN
jgi:hypothetical protein